MATDYRLSSDSSSDEPGIDPSVVREPTVRTVGATPQPAVQSLNPDDFPPGTVVAEKYRIDEALGEGGMGVVVAATHLQLRERVALKFLRLDDNAHGDVRSRFRREARICSRIRNEHIVRVLDVGTFGNAEYMVMEHLDGVDLRRALKAHGGPFPLERVADIAVQMCEGLAEVHAAGIVHRDLKPSNVFLTRGADGKELIKILDFGISKWTAPHDRHDEDLTKTGAILGSPKYMAPEQLFGSSSVDARADIWSLGAMLYELVTGRVPFDEPSFARLCAELASGDPPVPPRQHAPDTPPELDAAIMLCLQPEREERLPSVAALAGEILAAVGDPRAEPVRLRLETVLANGASNHGGSNSSGEIPAMKSGQYVTLKLAKEGSNPSIRVQLDSVTPAQISAAAPIAAPTPRPNRAWMLAALLVVPIAFFAYRATRPTPAEVAKSTAITAAPSPIAPAVTSAPPPPDVSAASPPPTPAALTATSMPVVKKITKSAAAPTPSVSAAPIPPPVTTTSAKKKSPLEERQ